MVDQNIDLDPNTGFPKLPQGLAWRIEEVEVVENLLASPELKVKKAAVSIVKVSEWWTTSRYTDAGVALTGETRKVTNSVPFNFLDVDTWFSRTETHTEWKQQLIKYVVSRTASPGFSWESADVLELSFEVYEDWVIAEAIEAKKHAITGLYPPKKLEVG